MTPPEIHLVIYKNGPEEAQWKPASYKVPFRPGMSVLDALLFIEESHPDPPAFRRYKCKRGQCGSCIMTINGQVHKACVTLVEPNKDIILEPVKALPLFRDLVVRFQRSRVTVIEDNCNGCKLCVEVCPCGVLDLLNQPSPGGYCPAFVLYQGICLGCKQCENVCTEGAIFVEHEAGESCPLTEGRQKCLYKRLGKGR